MGDGKFDNTMRGFVLKHSLQSAGEEDFARKPRSIRILLVWFFSQWLDSTGARNSRRSTPSTVWAATRASHRRLRYAGLGFVPHAGNFTASTPTEKRRNVSSTSRARTRPSRWKTFGRRDGLSSIRMISAQNSPDIRLRTALLRGQQMVQTGELTEALKEFASALEANKNSSLAHYRIARCFSSSANYQAAANAYRESINAMETPLDRSLVARPTGNGSSM